MELYTDRGNRSTRRNVCRSATLSTTNATWTDPGSKLSGRHENSAIKIPRYITQLSKKKKSGINLQTNASRFLKENCFYKSCKAPRVCPSSESNMQMKLSIDYWWNNTNRE